MSSNQQNYIAKTVNMGDQQHEIFLQLYK